LEGRSELGENQKQTVVFFGAGGAGLAFRHHSGVEPDFYVDSSPALHGTRVGGVPVVDPSALAELSNVKVYITSGYVDEITQALLEIGVPGSAIVEIPKSQMGMHPFATDEARASASERLAELVQSVRTPESVLCVGGTALGFARSRDFISWDFDVDLFCRDSSREELLRALEADSSWKFTKKTQSNVQGLMIRELPLLDIPVGVSFFQDSLDYTDRYNNREWIWPSKVLMDPEAVEVRGHIFYLPNPSSTYLAEVYGSDWQTERSDFAYSDYGGSQVG